MKPHDRKSGWKYAKLSGHTNEANIEELLNNDVEFASIFLQQIGKSHNKILSANVGGLHETNVPSILGKTTKSKTDLKVYCDDNQVTCVSIKKSSSGQVYLVKASHFIEIFEKHFNKTIPPNIKTAIGLLWAECPTEALNIIEKFSSNNHKDLQQRHKSLNGETLKKYDATLYDSLLDWFKTNIYSITLLCFSMGAAKDKDEWSQYVWYINTLGEEKFNDIFDINKIAELCQQKANTDISFSNKNGGTTIQLPFGFVQWHQSSMQFHHQYDKINNLCNEDN